MLSIHDLIYYLRHADVAGVSHISALMIADRMTGTVGLRDKWALFLRRYIVAIHLLSDWHSLCEVSI